MLWRLYQTPGVNEYRHGSDPWALVVFPPQLAAIGKAIGSDTVRAGYNVVILSKEIRHSDEYTKSLRTSFSTIETDRKIEILTVDSEKHESFVSNLHSLLRDKNLTLNVICVDPGLAQPELASNAVYPLKFSDFVQIQQATLPLLSQNTPTANIVVACPSSGTDFRQAMRTETYFESFCSEMSRNLVTKGYSDIQVKLMDCYAVASEDGDASHGIFVPSASTLSASILRSTGHSTLSTIPYWPHELWSWVIWLLLLFMPQKLLEKLIGYS